MEVSLEHGPRTSVLPAGPAITRLSDRGKLVVVEGPDEGLEIPVGPEPVTLGSATGADIVLKDRTISRRHLAVARAERGVRAWDLGSTNGCYVHESRFSELWLGFGAQVRIGRTVLKLVPEEERVSPPPSTADRFGKLLGRDPKIRQLFRILEEVAPSDTTVLIEGETGTGKELFAEEIHAHSARATGPFVVFDCGAVPNELIQSALFGHVRGAFTGALADRKGAFSEANRGTLFLDEIGELPLAVQPVLLRALDRRMVRPVGGASYQNVDIRVVAATNRDLRKEVSAGRFREDLYYRLAVVKLQVPPLRERGADLRMLVEKFIREVTRDAAVRIPADQAERLERYAWPGNVRELRNVVERACLLRTDDFLQFELNAPTGGPVQAAIGNIDAEALRPYRDMKQEILDRFEREYLTALARRYGENLSAAARAAQVDRKHLRDLMRRHGLRSD